jgi:hypothetical protein
MIECDFTRNRMQKQRIKLKFPIMGAWFCFLSCDLDIFRVPLHPSHLAIILYNDFQS